MNTIHVFSRATPLYDVRGRIEYTTSPERQEHLLAVAGETDPSFWDRLAEESQLAWRAAGGNKERKCCEAREIVDTLPNSALQEDMNELAEKIAKRFTEKYSAPCIVAIHLNKAESSLHYHLIFCDRLVLPVPDIHAADRNIFLDENGVRKRTKKEILDEEGELRPGCRIVPKGEVLSERHFGPKEDLFTSKGWLQDYKQDLADWINEELKPDKRRTVYDTFGPYLPQQRIPKGTPKEKAARIKKYNGIVKKFNTLIDEGKLPEWRAKEIKEQVLLAPDRYEALEAAIFPENVKVEVPGGERTRGDPNELREQQKQNLRKLYRESRLAWQKYRDEIDGSVEKKIALSKARRVSAKIDALKKEMGLFTTEEYIAAVKKEEEELRQKREVVLNMRRVFALWAKKDPYDYYSLHNQLERCRKELWELPPLFACTDEERARRIHLNEEIEALHELQIVAWHNNKMAKQYYREAKKELREKRRAAREARKELQRHKEKEKEEAKAGDR